MMPVQINVATQLLTWKAPTSDQELADESAGSRESHRGEREQHEDRGVDRHAVHQPAIARDVAGVHPVIDHADDEEEGAGHDAVAQHLEDRALDALHRAR